MTIEITKNRLKQYFYPSYTFAKDAIMLDYVEVLIDPTGIKRLEQELEKYNIKTKDKKENDCQSEYTEHIRAFVYFFEGTNIFYHMTLNICKMGEDIELTNIDNLLYNEEKANIIEFAADILYKYKKAKKSVEYTEEELELMLKSIRYYSCFCSTKEDDYYNDIKLKLNDIDKKIVNDIKNKRECAMYILVNKDIHMTEEKINEQIENSICCYLYNNYIDKQKEKKLTLQRYMKNQHRVIIQCPQERLEEFEKRKFTSIRDKNSNEITCVNLGIIFL